RGRMDSRQEMKFRQPSRSTMDKRRSASRPDQDTATRAWPAASSRCVNWAGSVLGVVGLAALVSVAPGCHELDTERALPKRGSVGQEMYGVLCDRLAAQALREDLSGASFRDVCHEPPSGD